MSWIFSFYPLVSVSFSFCYMTNQCIKSPWITTWNCLKCWNNNDCDLKFKNWSMRSRGRTNRKFKIIYLKLHNLLRTNLDQLSYFIGIPFFHKLSWTWTNLDGSGWSCTSSKYQKVSAFTVFLGLEIGGSIPENALLSLLRFCNEFCFMISKIFMIR